MERQIFDWEFCQFLDYDQWQFQNCILLIDVGSHNKGSTFEFIEINYKTGKMIIVSEPENEIFDLLLTVHS